MKTYQMDDIICDAGPLIMVLLIPIVGSTVGFSAFIGLPVWAFAILLGMSICFLFSVSLTISACYHIHTVITDYSVEYPSWDDAKAEGGGDYLTASKIHDKRKEEYERKKKYKPIERMSKQDTIVLILSCFFWPFALLKCLFNKLCAFVEPVTKTFTFIFGEKNETD